MFLLPNLKKKKKKKKEGKKVVYVAKTVTIYVSVMEVPFVSWAVYDSRLVVTSNPVRGY